MPNLYDAADLQPREPGHSHTVVQDCVASECTGHPDWKLIRDAGEVKPATRATIAMEKIARLLPWSDVAVGWHSPATPEQVADALERLQAELAKLITRATEAEAERNHYREVIAGGRAWLGLVVPELVYPARILQGLPDSDDAPEWPMHVGTLHVLPPDPLTELQASVNAMLEKLDTMMPTWRDGKPPTLAESARAALDECVTSELCDADVHLMACPKHPSH